MDSAALKLFRDIACKNGYLECYVNQLEMEKQSLTEEVTNLHYQLRRAVSGQTPNPYGTRLMRSLSHRHDPFRHVRQPRARPTVVVGPSNSPARSQEVASGQSTYGTLDDHNNVERLREALERGLRNEPTTDASPTDALDTLETPRTGNEPPPAPLHLTDDDVMAALRLLKMVGFFNFTVNT